MNSEGRGIVAPEPVWVPIARADFLILKDVAIRRQVERDYRSKRNAWARGMVGPGRPRIAADLRRSEYSIYVGLIGEHGACQYINSRLGRKAAVLDLESRERGDGGVDIHVVGLAIQVKTQQHPGGAGLIRCVTEGGRELPLTARCYVFALYDRDHQDGVSLLGWAWARDVVRQPRRPARRGGHTNIEVPRSLYLPASRLIKELRQREESDQWR